jgi:serine/threonine protein kinase
MSRDAPASLGEYPLLGLLGQGSMGTVYVSKDPRTGRPLAVKTVRRELLRDTAENFAEQLRLEALAARGLSHPGILQVYDYGEEADVAYIVMEYSDGSSLQEHFDRHESFSSARAVNLTCQLLEALQYAHDRGVWHRDIKPANLLITGNDQLKVADFGIARLESAGQAGAVMGTPGYIAPETYLTDSFDHRVDVFAAGAVLYQLLTGALPFSGAADQVMFAVCYENPMTPSVAAFSNALRPFDSVVLQALAKRPADRYLSADLFRTALLQAQQSIRPAAGLE